MMERYKILIKQNLYKTSTGEVMNEYHFFTENGIYLGALRFPGDGQFMFDAKLLAPICKALGIRWGLIKSKAAD